MDSYVSFPRLGLSFPVHEELFRFELFGTTISIRWYGVLIALGFLLAVWYATRRADEFGIDRDKMTDIVLVSTLFAFVGARLYYVLFSADRMYYFRHPVEILKVWNGGLAIYGGVLAAFITGLWMCKLRRVQALRMFDLAAPGFLIGQALGRWGNFFNQEAFGGNTTLPWGMTGSRIADVSNNLVGYDHALPVHPTFLYESLWCLLGLLLIHSISKKAYRFRGQLFSLYIMWYGTGRFFIEMLRTDSLYLGTMRVSCLVAVLSVIGGAVLFFVLRGNDRFRLAAETAGEAVIEEEQPSIPLAEEPAEESATDTTEEEIEDGDSD